MGLAASQVRLLSLTARQQSVEAAAQRILSNKIRLSNDSDNAYKKYMNVLEDTTLKSLQTNSVGERSWIDGNVLNLMRLNAPDDTKGTTFYVQNIENGKLYVTEDIAKKYDDYINLTASTIPSGHIYTEEMKFATLFGVTYDKVDKNIDLKIEYDNAINNGWHTALTREEYENYLSQKAKDDEIKATSGALRGMVNRRDKDDKFYKAGESVLSIDSNYQSYVIELMNSTTFKELMTSQNFAGCDYETNMQLLTRSLDILNTFDANVPKNIISEDGNYASAGIYGDIDYKYDITYDTRELIAENDDGEYITKKDGSYDLTSADRFNLMLNGGKTIWRGNETLKIHDLDKYPSYIKNYLSPLEHEYLAISDVEQDVYSTEDTDFLNANYAGAKNYGDVLNALFKELFDSNAFESNYLKSIGKTLSDVTKYRKFESIKNQYAMYRPEYEYVPSNNIQSQHYETLFKAITRAGGCIPISDACAKNDTWVSNMIKNAQVILTTWDSEEETLSRTSPALHTDVQEVADTHKVAQAEQEYDAIMAVIDAKDANYDNKLTKLESERTAIKTEVDGIKKVMDDNVQSYFKVFT